MQNTKTVTFQRAHNYGALLQSFALQQTIISLGYNNEIIDYDNNLIFKNYNPFYFKGLSKKKTIKKFIKLCLYYKPLKNRYNNMNDFINNNLKLTKRFENEKIINNFINKNDILITGSDQVWNPNITRGINQIYTLNIGNNTNKKISYAASIGDVNELIKNKEAFKKSISKFYAISVREEDLKNELSKIVDKEITQVLDPVLLLTKETWNKKITKFKEKQKYIFAYVVAPDEEYIKIVNELSDRLKLCVIHSGLKNPGYKNVIGSIYEKGPFDFIQYIKNAEYVVTTSFHATAFSVIYNKNFCVIPNKKTGERVISLLNLLNIQNRTYNNIEEFLKIDFLNIKTDWQSVNQKLEKERKKSIKWLKEAIK